MGEVEGSDGRAHSLFTSRLCNNAEGGGGEDNHQGAGPEVDGEEHDEPRLLPGLPAEELGSIMGSTEERVDSLDRVAPQSNLSPSSLRMRHQEREDKRCLCAERNKLTQPQPLLLVDGLAAMEMPVDEVMAKSGSNANGQTDDHGPLAVEERVPEGRRASCPDARLAELEDAAVCHDLGLVGLDERVDLAVMLAAEDGRGRGIWRLPRDGLGPLFVEADRRGF